MLDIYISETKFKYLQNDDHWVCKVFRVPSFQAVVLWTPCCGWRRCNHHRSDRYQCSFHSLQHEPMEPNDTKEPYQCMKNRKTIRLLYSTFTKWTVTCFVPVNFAFHDDDTVTWNNNLYGVNYANGLRFYWIKNAILIVCFNASCMYVCVVYLAQRQVSRAMKSIKYYIEII